MFNFQNVSPTTALPATTFMLEPILVTAAIIFGSLAIIGAVIWFMSVRKLGKAKTSG